MITDSRQLASRSAYEYLDKRRKDFKLPPETIICLLEEWENKSSRFVSNYLPNSALLKRRPHIQYGMSDEFAGKKISASRECVYQQKSETITILLDRVLADWDSSIDLELSVSRRLVGSLTNYHDFYGTTLYAIRDETRSDLASPSISVSDFILYSNLVEIIDEMLVSRAAWLTCRYLQNDLRAKDLLSPVMDYLGPLEQWYLGRASFMHYLEDEIGRENAWRFTSYIIPHRKAEFKDPMIYVDALPSRKMEFAFLLAERPAFELCH